MTTTAIRKKLMSYIADADDKKVKGLYLLVEDEIAYAEKFKYSSADVKILEQERDKHVKGKSKSYTWKEAKEIIRSKKKP
jgi:N-acetylglutamate synthase-like GNAT family acetyltransferase